MAYLLLLVMLLLLIFGPQFWVQRIMTQYNRHPEENFPGNGGELARHLLDHLSLQQVQMEATDSADHYDPLTKTVRLSKDKLEGKTLTAITTAAHEVGHALQDAADEPLFRWRSRLGSLAVGAQRIGSFLLFAAPILSVITRVPSAGVVSALAAFLVMGSNILLQLATLPVELDASFKKALPLLKSGYLTPDQYKGAEKILRAAAFTYLSASLAGLLNFWQWMRVLKR
ncbi:MAG: zinc metallopeptidase [Candidatus Thiodiazotropha sp. (ex Lucinoma aequizonata)]|nr:zinc metallopeptidase [Candidatus Thiodiazotropha sp. (ex Lucinoma aequizonata)]MCU7888694.1 zinc metallopeptidase [Candidatus Thiodiazotropha sp. (ex Lucinoma aequizonata)]MCU7896525.1 zinc metallopeptidase [Candidatus Thiodiazotropha sp. (ex Lucinoma aequizonata)]MCU7899267.1 zinc metallopeptidase [Candidatus Thiodiazotropha sp. (ex Lucinoma aequizonata)]MCU7900994.1 zinc metallopeptidase [Candidatus Thiodiazotropha sp. (ex Lucinoma aequizonata)]